MKIGPLVGLSVGGLGLTGLLAYYGVAPIGAAVLSAGWGLIVAFLVLGLQLPPPGLAWRALLPDPSPPSFAAFVRLRWIREAVNNLLPVAQIGGEVVGARLLARHGPGLALSAASATVDLSVELATQILFTLAGLVLLAIRPHGGEAAAAAGPA